MYIYKTTCLINNKIYIGQSSLQVEKSYDYLGSGTAFKRALNKYGAHNFKKEILKRDLTSRHQLDIWEKIYILKFKSSNKYIGYNLCKGSPAEVDKAKYEMPLEENFWAEFFKTNHIVAYHYEGRGAYGKKLRAAMQRYKERHKEEYERIFKIPIDYKND